MKKLAILILIAGFILSIGAFSMLYAAPLPDEIEMQNTDTNASQDVSEDQADKQPSTTEYRSMGIEGTSTVQSSSSVEDVKGLISGFKSGGYDLLKTVTTLKDSGYSSNDIALGLISNEYSGEEVYNVISKAFSVKAADKAVPISLVDTTKDVQFNATTLKSAGLSYESMSNALVESGSTYKEIVGVLKSSGASAQEVFNILQGAGYGDKKIVTIMLEGNFTVEGIVQGMVDQGMSITGIIEGFKKKNHTKVVAELIKSGISTDEVISVATNANISTSDIAVGLSAGGLALEEVFSVMADQGVSESKVLGYLVDGGSKTTELATAMINMGKGLDEIFKAFKDEGDYSGEMLCVALINSGNFTIAEVVSGVAETGIGWDKIALGLKNSGSTTSEIIEMFQSNDLTEKKIVEALRKNCNFGVSSIVAIMNDLGWSMDTIIASFGDADNAAVVTGLIKAEFSAEKVINLARSTDISWANITDGLTSTGMDSGEIYTLLSDQGLSDSKIVNKMLDTGRETGVIVSGLINLGMDINSIFEAFKEKKAKEGKSVVSAMVKSGNYTLEEITVAAEEVGMKTTDIVKGMEFGGTDFAEIVQNLKDNGMSDREVVTAMMDKDGGNISDIVQGMLDLGWDSTSIFEAFKEKSDKTFAYNNFYYDQETSKIVLESYEIRGETKVFAGLVGAGVSVEEVVSIATKVGMTVELIAQGLYQAGSSAADAFATLNLTGSIDSRTVKAMLDGGYSAGNIANTMLDNGRDMNKIIGLFTSESGVSNAAALVNSFLHAGFETDFVISTVKAAGASWKDIASGLKANGFEPKEVIAVLNDNNLSDVEIVTAMLDDSDMGFDNLMEGIESLGWDMNRVIVAFEDAGVGKTAKVISLLALDYSATDVASSAFNSGFDWETITQGFKMSEVTTENACNALTNNGLDNKTIAGLMVDAGYDHAELVDVMKNQGMSFSDIISAFTNNRGSMIVDMSVLINAYKITPA